MVVGFCLLFDLRLWSTNQTINQEKSSARDYVFCVFVCFVCFVCFRLLRITHPLHTTHYTLHTTHYTLAGGWGQPAAGVAGGWGQLGVAGGTGLGDSFTTVFKSTYKNPLIP